MEKRVAAKDTHVAGIVLEANQGVLDLGQSHCERLGLVRNTLRTVLTLV
jgi:hypothetical protein